MPQKRNGFSAGWRGRAPAELRGALLDLVDDVQAARDRVVPALALALVRQVKVLLSTPGRGRIYEASAQGLRRNRLGQFLGGRFKGRKRRHQASAPYDPPAVDTGALRASIDMEPIEGSGVQIGPFSAARRNQGYRVGTNIEYGPWLEFGTTGYDRTSSSDRIDFDTAPFTGGNVEPRPFLRPAVALVKRAWGQMIVGMLKFTRTPRR